MLFARKPYIKFYTEQKIFTHISYKYTHNLTDSKPTSGATQANTVVAAPWGMVLLDTRQLKTRFITLALS